MNVYKQLCMQYKTKVIHICFKHENIKQLNGKSTVASVNTSIKQRLKTDSTEFHLVQSASACPVVFSRICLEHSYPLVLVCTYSYPYRLKITLWVLKSIVRFFAGNSGHRMRHKTTSAEGLITQGRGFNVLSIADFFFRKNKNKCTFSSARWIFLNISLYIYLQRI